MNIRLPNSWSRDTLGSINVYKSTTLDPQKHPHEIFELYSVPAFPTDAPEIIKGMNIGSTKQIVQYDDVLVCKINPKINRVWLVTKNDSGYRQIASSEWIVIRSKKFDSRFLQYFFRCPDFRERFCQDLTGVGGSLTRAQPTRVRKLSIPLAPINEQKRIADKLDSLLYRVDSCREKLEKMPDLLKRLKLSILAAATSGRLTEDWRKKHKIRFDWQEVSVGSLCSNSFYGPRFSKDDYVEDGIPTIRTTDMTDDGEIEITSETPRIKVPESKIDTFKLDKGDLLITRTGSIGTMAIFKGNYLAIPSAYLIRFRFNESVKSEFIFYCLMSPKGQQAMGFSSTAITQPNINAEAIKKISIQLPGKNEQETVLGLLESYLLKIRVLEKHVFALQNHLAKIKKSILSKAFRGELVQQDPNDEPASLMLEQIKKENQPKETKKEKVLAAR